MAFKRLVSSPCGREFESIGAKSDCLDDFEWGMRSVSVGAGVVNRLEDG